MFSPPPTICRGSYKEGIPIDEDYRKVARCPECGYIYEVEEHLLMAWHVRRPYRSTLISTQVKD